MDISTVDDELYARSIHFLLKFMTTHKMVYHAVWWTRLHRSWCEGDRPRLGIELMSEDMFLIVANLKNCNTQPDTWHQPLHSKEFGSRSEGLSSSYHLGQRPLFLIPKLLVYPRTETEISSGTSKHRLFEICRPCCFYVCSPISCP